MTYFKIGDTDFSSYVNELSVTRESNYNAQTNANGDTVVEYINSKRVIEVGFIPLENTSMIRLQQAISPFSVKISYLDPTTNTLRENVGCIVPEDSIEYYTIQQNKVMYNAMSIEFIEL